jgi:ketosteroid isomerase-like protein
MKTMRPTTAAITCREVTILGIVRSVAATIARSMTAERRKMRPFGAQQLLALIVIAALSAACGGNVEGQADRVHEARAMLETAYNNRDVGGMVTILTDDTIFLPPGAPAMIGRDNVVAMHQASFRQAADRYTSTLDHTSEEVILAGEWAVDRGIYVATITPVDGGAPGAYLHNYLYVWARQTDGSYKLRRAIANPSGQ